MQSIFVAYRTNTLFARYLPELLDGLPVVGTFVVPSGDQFVWGSQTHTNCKNAVLAALDKGAGLLTDLTCHPYQRIGVDCKGSLAFIDKLFSEQIDAKREQSTSVDNLVWFAKELAEGRSLRQIIVVERSIADHDLVGSDNLFQMLSGTREQRAAQRAEGIAGILGENFPGIETVIAQPADLLLCRIEDPNTMVVIDRHATNHVPDYGALRRTILYTLPFEDSALGLIERGNLSWEFDIAEMQEKLRFYFRDEK